jgi:DNA-binding GntR family transcriptional regulator
MHTIYNMQGAMDGLLTANVSAVIPRSLPDTIYSALREAVLSGVYHPGQALRQEALAKQFQASRVPVREALKRLEAEGLVVLKPRRGFVVTSLEINEIEEVFQLRMVLEEHAAYVATVTRTESDVVEVGTLLEALDNTPIDDAKGIAQWASLNRQFHSRLIASSGRQHLGKITKMLRDMVETYVRVEVSMTGDLNRAQSEHHQIFEAFRARDAATAGKLSREHCGNTAERLIKALRARMEGSGKKHLESRDSAGALSAQEPRRVSS